VKVKTAGYFYPKSVMSTTIHGKVSLNTVSFLFTGLTDNLRPHLDSAEAQNLERGKKET